MIRNKTTLLRSTVNKHKATIPWYRIKRICSFNYRRRGTEHRDTTYAIKHRTPYGRFVIEHRKKLGYG